MHERDDEHGSTENSVNGEEQTHAGATPSRRDVIKLAAAASATPLMSAMLPNALMAGAESSLRLPNGPLPLEPVTQKFIDSLAGAKPLYEMTPQAAHQVLTTLQSKPVKLMPADIKDMVFPVGPTGTTNIRIVRPKGTTATLPVLMYFHGGGWVLGDKTTHDRLVRELANGTQAALVFVDYVNSPKAKYPTQNEQAYASMLYVVSHAKELNVDPRRMAVAGDSVGGNMVAAVTLMNKARNGPRLLHQVMFYPVVQYMSNTDSMREFANGPWLTAKTMKWMFDLQGLTASEKDITAYPLRASVDQLRGLPPALLITDDDILRDDGEMYGAKLSQAGVRVTSLRYNQTIHDFVMLNPIAETPAVDGAVKQASEVLRAALHA